jgi:predicted permease
MSTTQLTRHAWRALRRTPVFTITASLTLVIGIGAAVAIFAVVNGVLLKPLPYGNPDRLVAAWHDLPPLSLNKANQTASTWMTYKRLARTIEGIGIYQEGAVNVADPGGTSEPQRLAAGFISEDVLRVLRVTPLLGRNFTEEEDRRNGPEVVIISEGLWRTRFAGDPAVIGRTMDVGGLTRQIVGVMPQSFRFPHADTKLWVPLRVTAEVFTGGFNYTAVARLKPGVEVADAQRDFAAVLPRIVELYPTFVPGVTTQMLMDQAKPVPVLIPLRDDVIGSFARTLWIVAGAAALVLLVACANVTNLILVRADGRQRELAVREALGAGRARVMTHFLAESAVLTGIAGLLGLGVAWVTVRALVSASPITIPRLADVSVDLNTVLFALLVSALVAVVCSIVPALRIGRVHLSNALREGGRGGTAGRAQQRVRGVLVAAQIAIALVVLAGSGLLYRSYQGLHEVKPGFDPRNVATLWVSLPRARYVGDSASARFYAQLDERVGQLPGVEAAGLASRLPLSVDGLSQNPLYPEDDPATWANKIPPLQLYNTTDGDFFRAMGIPLIAGRTFDRLDRQRGNEAVISQATAVMFWKDSTGRAALGKRFRQLPGSGPLYTVVGVVGSTRDSSLAAPPVGMVYFPQVVDQDTTFSQTARTLAVVVRSPNDPAAMVRAVQRVVRELDPALPTFDIRSMATIFDASMSQLSFTMLILGAAAFTTLLLGAIGLYGVMAYAVTLRTRELGVRIALGAQPSAVAAMMTRQGIALTAAGIVSGLALFALVARFLQSFLFGVAPGDPVTLAAASLLLVLIAAAASWVPARRASRVDPVEALRAE